MSSNSARIAITGAAGFLGAALARRLLAGDAIMLGGRQRVVGELVLLDLVRPADDLAEDPRVRVIVGDLSASPASFGSVDAVFHLAGVVSGHAESDFDLGMRTNLDGLRRVLDACRAMDVPPVVVFSSSLAVYGSDPAIGAVGEIDDDTLPRPQSSYGIQKFVGEQLVADYTRKGFLRGRSVRLMTVAVRPGRPNAAASSFISGMIREPLAGLPAVCPVPMDMPIAVSSPRKTLEGILRASELGDAEWGSRTAMNLPALTTTPRHMAEALRRAAGPEAVDRIRWLDDAGVIDIVGSWPSVFHTARADSLGLTAEDSFDDIVRQYIESRAASAGSSPAGGMR